MRRCFASTCRHCASIGLASVFLVLLGGIALAGPVGPEFQVSTSTNDDKGADVGIAADGSFVIVWDDKTAFDILARRYDASGNPLGAVFQVNTSANQQQKARIGVAADGRFVIVWEDKTGLDVLARRYDAFGNPLGAVFQVSTSVNDQKGPDVGIAADGSFVIVWDDKIALDILARRYDAIGNPLGAVFQVSTSANDQKKARIGVATGGSFVIVWEDKTALDILARRYDAFGNPLGAVFQVNTSANNQKGANIGIAADGSFVIVWDDKTAFDILARRYDAFGNPLGAVFQVNTSANQQQKASIGVAADGRFVVVWEDKTALDVMAREYSALGSPLGSAFVVNTTVVGDQKSPSVSRNANGDYVVVWEDKTTLDIYGQRYSDFHHWAFDETSGTVAADSIGSSDGTLVNFPGDNSQWSCFNGGSLLFDGVDDYVSLPVESDYDFTNSVTVAGWIRVTNFGIYEQALITKGDTAWRLERNGATKTVQFSVNGLTTNTVVQGSVSVNDGEWHHVAGVYDGAQLLLYVDGQLDNAVTATGTMDTNNSAVYLGANAEIAGRNFSGRMDDVTIYNTALNASQIATLAQSSLLVWWKLNETSGTTASDSSGYGNDGVISGNPVWQSSGGQIDGALECDGIGDQIEDSDAENYLNGLTEFTVFAWVKSDVTNVDKGIFITKIPDNNDNILAMRYDKVGASGGASEVIKFALKTSSGNKNYESSASVQTTSWQHLAITWTSGGTPKLYIDGTLNILTANGGSLGGSVAGVTKLLVGIGAKSKHWDGMIDDFRIYDRAFCAGEIAAVYEQTSSGGETHWAFDEGSGTTAANSTTSAYDATLQGGATWTSDCSGASAIEFDGLGAYAITVQPFSPPSTGTIAFWMRSAGAPAARSRIFGLGNNWETRQETDGTLSFDLGAGGPPTFVTLSALDQANRWYHVVAVFDADDDSFQVYVDGQLDTSGVNGNDMVAQSAGLLSFGTRTGSSDFWKGGLRDFRVYGKKLTTAEVADLYGMLAYWKLDESTGPVAVDSSGRGYDATYVNAPTLGVIGPHVPKTGTAVELDGTSDYITSGVSLLNDLTEFSLAGWVRPDSTSPDSSFFGQNGLIELGIDLQTNQIDFWTSAGGSLSVSAQLPLGKWSHVAAVGDGTQLKLYLNGVEVAAGGSATGNYGSNSNLFKIGEGVLTVSGGYFDGRIDDVRVYSRALCPEQINDVYKGGRPPGVRILQWLETR